MDRIGFNGCRGAWLRVNGPMSNLPEFGAAWSCPAGAPMVRPPAERCEIW